MYATVIATLLAAASALPNYGVVPDNTSTQTPTQTMNYGTVETPSQNDHTSTVMTYGSVETPSQNDQTPTSTMSYGTIETPSHNDHYQNNTYGQVPPPKPCDEENKVQNGNSTFSAILFDGTQFTGEKHWVDGSKDECRGLSGVSVNSTMPVAFPGADQSTTGNARSDFEMVFFSNFSCSGDVLGSVPASTADVVATLGRAVFPLSVQFRQVDVTYTEKQGESESTESNDAAESTEGETSDSNSEAPVDPVGALSEQSSASTISLGAALIASTAALFI